jgi:glycosyltransferase involved in cell wall biosynthesis
MNKFKVSVIVNFHNSEKYLHQCIRSIINQDYQNLEIILWDNCSTDESLEIIKSFNDNRIKYFFNKKKVKLYKARNNAIKSSSGELIAFLDADDWWEKNYLSSREKFFFNLEFDFFYSNTNFYYEKSDKYKIYRDYKLPHGNIFNNLSKDYFLIISGIIFRRDIFDNYGLFNENYNIIGDYEFLMKISQYSKAHASDIPLLNYRVHENNFSKIHNDVFLMNIRIGLKKILLMVKT